MSESTITVSDEQVAFFHSEGYLVIDAITTPEEVVWMRELYDGLFAERVGYDDGNQFDLAGTDEEGSDARLPQMLAPSFYAPTLRDTIYRANALEVARRLLGPEAEFRFDHAILKPAEAGAETPWHQDEAYWDPAIDYDELSIWMPLQDVGLENGCMHFVPGSHARDVLPHRSIGNDPRIHGLEVDLVVDVSTAVACPIPAGGATVHHCRMVHYTTPNLTSEPRRAYILSFGAPQHPRDRARDFYWLRAQQTARAERAREARERRRAAKAARAQSRDA